MQAGAGAATTKSSLFTSPTGMDLKSPNIPGLLQKNHPAVKVIPCFSVTNTFFLCVTLLDSLKLFKNPEYKEIFLLNHCESNSTFDCHYN